MMQVSLVHAEVQAAVVALLVKRGVLVEGQDIAVSFSMGRKNTGLTATVSIDDPEVKLLPAAKDAEAPEPDAPSEVATPVASSIPASAYAEAQAVGQEPVADPAPAVAAEVEENPPAAEAGTPFQAPTQEAPKSLFAS